MATLIAGILWQGPASQQPTKVLERMAHAMAPWCPNPQIGWAGPFGFALASRSGRSIEPGPGSALLLADADMAWWYSAAPPSHRPITRAELADALAHDPGKASRDLDGEFALAFWEPEAERLRLVRDGAGVRPLYYVNIPGQGIAFASLLPALTAAGLVDHQANHRVIAKLATSNYAHGTETQYTHINRVMPGQSVIFQRDKLRTETNWRLQCRDPISPRADRNETMQVLGGKIREAVRRRIPSDGPVLSHLSGGLDSSAIAALAAQTAHCTGQTVRAYAFAGRALPDDIRRVDERPALDAVLEAYPNIDLVEIRSPDRDMVASAPMSAYFPTFDDPHDLYEQVLRDAADQGATSLLAGFGGDEVVSYAGTGGFAEMFVRGRWRSLWRVSRSVARRSGRPAWRIVASELARFVLPRLLPGWGGHALGRSEASVRRMNSFLKPAFHQLAHEGDPELRPDTAWLRAQRIHFGHTFWVQEQAAHVSGLHGLRYASPLLDRDVLEFAVRLPPEFLHVDGLMRGGLREPMRNVLPEATRMRRTKLHYDPADGIYFARARAELIAMAEGLRDTNAATVFDLEHLTRELEAIPDVADVEDAVRAAGEVGEQYFLPQSTLTQPLLLARFLERIGGNTDRLADENPKEA